MPVLDISQFESTVVIYFKTDDRGVNDKGVNAYTLASTLVCLADAAKAANSVVNTGYEIEIIVEVLGPGSFRALIKAVYTNARNLFSREVVKDIVIGVLITYVCDRYLLDNKPTITVNTDEVVIQTGEDRVIIPRNVYEATRKVEKNPRFVRAVGRAFDSLAKDEKVGGLGFVKSMDSKPPEILIPRTAFQSLAAVEVPDDPDERTISEVAELQVVKAILEESYRKWETRKWEFTWHGVKISAPVTDKEFHADFVAHKIMLAPGDTLQVTLVIKQTKVPDTNVYANVGYQVVKVHGHAQP